MIEDDIKENAENRIDNVGIVIPDDLFQQYIERWFDGLVISLSVNNYIGVSRCFDNDSFRKSVQIYIMQLTRIKIEKIIHTGSKDFVNTMFVMTEDYIKEDSENRQDCFGIIIPVDLLQQYIGRLVDVLTKTDSVRKCIDVNRCFMNATFRISLQTYTTQLTSGKIGNLIRTGSKDFVNTMFVITEDDIKVNAENRNECFGFVIADDMLKHYFQRWFDSITKTALVKEDMNVNRLLKNDKGQAVMQNFIRQIHLEQTRTLIQTGSTVFLNTMFVTTNDYIKDNAVNRYECFGIVLSDHLLEHYIGRFLML
ncbi:unnamed protein product [Mytilus edulis]|uniref:Uncharacterized protein n=1 Tax=Mytilus edulis TaxID=6550 RepID=A0A8S3QWL7_MYTED|nr:unnamed protein product [Mytilus edulis]